MSEKDCRTTFCQADRVPYSYLQSQNLMYEFSLNGQTAEGMECSSSVYFSVIKTRGGMF